MNKFISTITLMLFDVVAIFLAIALAVSLRQILNLFFDLPVIGYSYLLFGSVYITLIFILFYFILAFIRNVLTFGTRLE